MSYNNQQGGGYGYSDYPSHSYQQSYTPQQQHAARDPFNDASYPSQSNPSLYPPRPYQNDYAHQSVDSFDDGDVPIRSATAGGAGFGAAAIVREKDNPYSAGYKGGGSGKKWWWIGGVVLLLIIAGGVGAGIGVWKSKDNSSDSSSTSNSTSASNKVQYIDGTAKVVKSNPSDPSDFEKDDRFHQSFWGMAYTPFLSQEPWCGATRENVTEDIQQLSQLTRRIRMYGMACNQTEFVLDAIAQTKVNMTVWLGVYIGDNATVNEQQKSEALQVLQDYGTDHVSGVTVGNEYLLNAVDKTTAATFVLSEVSDFKTRLAALNLDKTIPVGTADAGSEITATLAAGVDYFMANVHPFFGGLDINDAASWTWDFFEQNDVVITEPAGIDAYVAETGWPTNSMTAENLTYEGATAGVSELQTFLDTYPCTANTNGTMYFYFSPYDEPWKDQFGGVEPYWGLMDSNKILKDITLPTCESP